MAPSCLAGWRCRRLALPRHGGPRRQLAASGAPAPTAAAPHGETWPSSGWGDSECGSECGLLESEFGSEDYIPAREMEVASSSMKTTATIDDEPAQPTAPDVEPQVWCGFARVHVPQYFYPLRLLHDNTIILRTNFRTRVCGFHSSRTAVVPGR